MYAEEYLPNDAILEYEDNMSVTVDDLSTMDSEIIEQRLILKAYKKADTGYYTFKMPVGQDLVKIEAYSTLFDKKIRHAITGLRTSYLQNSKYIDLFFSVTDTSCLAPRQDNDSRRKLYYNNPEEYERHFRVTVPQDIKTKWSERNRAAKAKLRK